MSHNIRKEELLGQKFQLYLDEDLEEEIEMTNFKAINKNLNHYNKLQDQGDNSNLFHPRTQKNTQQNIPQRVFVDKPITPVTSYNFEPNKIFINGTTFVHVDAIKGQAKTLQKPKKPEMEVQCQYCCSLQMVPANTHSFICYSCDCTQGCNPQFGIFICGSCQKKVWYPLGTSNLIKCTKCGTVNCIPETGNQQNLQNSIPHFYEMNSKNPNQTIEYVNNEKYFTHRHPM